MQERIAYDVNIVILIFPTPSHGSLETPQEERIANKKIVKPNNTNAFIKVNFLQKYTILHVINTFFKPLYIFVMLIMQYTNPLINNDWDVILKDEFKKKSFKKTIQFVANERKKCTVFPSAENVFTAFKLSSFSKTRVVIIGQDPYHRRGQAHGLSFSVTNTKLPPSLKNILKELQGDMQIPITNYGNLEKWAHQGVLLLNAILTVREKEAGSHKDIGWENFTDAVISKLSLEKNGLVFLLWGKFAQKKSSLINIKKHYLLKTTHPSPFSAYRGFLGCKHFSKTNNILINNNQKPINWKLCSDSLTLF